MAVIDYSFNSETLRKEIKLYENALKNELAKLFADELTHECKMAIEDFYRDYTPKSGEIWTSYQWEGGEPSGVPKYYFRTYDNMLQNSYKRYYLNKGTYTVGGVRLSSDNFEGSCYKDDYSNEEVFNSVLLGYHGMVGNFENVDPIPRMKNYPMKRLRDKKREIKNDMENYMVEADKNVFKKYKFTAISIK